MLAGRVFALVLSLASAPIAFAQAYQPPRDAYGHADLQGVWTSRWLTPLERPAEAASLIVPAAEAKALRDVLYARFDAVDPLGAVSGYDMGGLLVIGGQHRSSLIVDPPDGRMPYTTEGRGRMARLQSNEVRPADNPEERGLNERCVTGANGVAPLLTAPAGNIRQIVQTGDHVVLWTELFNQLRIIPTDGRVRNDGRQGEARGRWEGDTLVVETTGVLDAFRVVRLSAIALTPRTRIVERFARISPDEIAYSYTIDDPALYARPWTAESSLKRTDERMYEFACHEGNYGLANILGAARVVERRAAKGASKPKPK